jgi:hypothetical protein
LKKSITCNTLSVTLSAKSVTSKALRSPKWHARTPAVVLLDKSISCEAKVAYGILALTTWQGKLSSLGLRELGRLMGKSQMSAKRYMDELVKAKAIGRHTEKSGKRAWYEFTSPVFGQKQRAGVESLVSYPRRRLATVRGEKAV